MRVADNMTFDQVRNNLQRNRTQMSELQNQAATQKRVTKPSDDPVSASRVLKSRIDLAGTKQYLKNLNYAKSFLEMSDQALGEVTESLMRVKELAIGQANDASASEESRRIVATEIEQLRDHIVGIGNRKLGDRFIFSGFKTQSKPFEPDGRYAGDDGEMLIHIDKTTFLPMNVAGNKVFLGEGLTSDGVVRGTQQQAQTIEEFRQQQLEEISQGAGGGFQGSAEANINIRGPASSGGFSVQASYGSGGKAASGGVNLFGVTDNLMIALRTNDKQAVQDSLEDIDDALAQVVLARSQLGSRVTAIDNLLQSLEKAKVDSAISISQNEDADIFSTISDINKTESTLQATLQTSGKLIQPSLLDFMR